MSDATPKLSLPYMVANQAQKEVTYNEALEIIDVIASSTFISFRAEPPSSPTVGDTYIVSATPSGEWSSYANYVAYYYSNSWLYLPPFEGMTMMLTGGTKTEYVYDAGAWKVYSSGGGGGGGGTVTTEIVTGNSIISHTGGVKSFEVHLPVRSGDTQIPVMRFKLNDVGFMLGNANYNASGYLRVNIQAGDVFTTSDFLISKTGSMHRVDYQKFLYGGSATVTDYYAESRGSKVLPQNVLSSPGYLGWTNNAAVSSVGTHNHMNGGLTWQGIPYSGMTDYQLGSPYAHHHTITELASDGAHYHTVTVTAAYKISAEGGVDGSVDKHAELGTSSSPLFSPAFYTSGGTIFGNYYSKLETDYMELRLNSVDSSRARVARVSIEFMNCNNTVWFYDAEKQTWPSAPSPALLGDSIMEQVDFNGTVRSPGGAYGSTYRFIASDIIGAANYGIGGQRTDQINGRVTTSGGTLYIDGGANTNSVFIIDGGINDCIRKAMYDNSIKFSGESYDSSWTFSPVANISSLVSKIRSCGKKVIFTMCPPINASLYTSTVAAQAITDLGGNNPSTMPPALWTTIAALWNTTKTELDVFCKENNVPVVDWYTPIENQGSYRSDLSYDGIHLNARGYSVLASLMYDALYSVVGNGCSTISVDMKGARGEKGADGAAGATGATGAQGIQGVKGDQGDPLTIGAVDVYANISNHDSEAAGFVFLASDTSTAYVRVGTSGWSSGVPFVGEQEMDGGTATSVYTSDQSFDGGGAIG